jgi:two-component system cell cycle response regulator
MTARILVVDDIPVNVRLLQAKLSAEYFEVLTAEGGPEALEIVERDQPDIVLLDVMMPVMDGFEVCRRIKLNPKTGHIPVVMVTALDDTASRIKGLEAGADDFLTKPVNDLALFARVRSLVRLKTMMDEWRVRVGTVEQLGEFLTDPREKTVDASNAHFLLFLPLATLAEHTREILEAQGHRVAVAADAAEALAAGKTTAFDTIVIELTFGSEDGLRLCSQLRSQEETRHVPIIMIVDEADTPRLIKALDIGANDYLIRPFDQNELIARARTQIRRRRYHLLLRENVGATLSLALTDGLTGVYNRRYLMRHLETLLAEARAAGKPLAVAMIDIDHFKRVNDTFGHAVGDTVLKEVVRRASGNLRTSDTTARYGGEEFCVVMPDTDEAAALLVAERLRERVGGKPISADGMAEPLVITVSVGVACLGEGTETLEALLKASDTALYRAKAEGRNRVIAASGAPVPA